ncbi:MAG TPA: hypothetical protein VGF16_16345 [Bryobacteraceae bacterium]|jgi:hypothetical protein
MAAVLKVSVLADGAVLLDGKPVTLSELAQAMDAVSDRASVVWYYRENASSDGPPSGLEVMKLIVERRMPVRLSSKPDFSDAVTPQTAIAFEPLFQGVRQCAAQRYLVIQRLDGRQVRLPALAKEAAPPQAVAAVERLLPRTAQRNIAVIAETSWAIAEKPNVQDAAGAIPFFGLLMGFAAVGHAVWVFDADGMTSALAAGCRDADLVIVDGDRLETFPVNWQDTVEPVMRTPRILVYDRAARQLRRL